jgi:hypothetical protein
MQVTTPVGIVEQEPGWYNPGVLFPSDETNATDTLVLTVSVDGLFKGTETKWPYRRLTKREEYTGGGKSVGMSADGSSGGYGLSILPSPLDAVTGTNIVFSVQYYGSHAGIRSESKASIVVPLGEASSGRVEKLTYKSEWRPNKTSESIAVKRGKLSM